ncbi:ABC transporter substrate-binding protein [Conexibacter sp. SYSU D00693]|uniref:ABC transporter substrate-binding protein n=1 Tax=Conexibacter sp. SYSU D00693 TaxID=2812560 RepID=UPI00196AC5CB|nr:ABC transporter substrate-binding protein [Conexibacter sp. SYSU D00693]
MTRTLTAALAAVAALGLSACGEKKEASGTEAPPPAERATLMLDYLPNADHAGIYAARAAGDLRRAGVDLRLQTPSDPAAPLKLVAAGKVDFAISYEPEVLLARDKGLPVAAVGALVQKPLTSLMSVKGSGVKRVEDLRGKRVGTAGIPYQDAYLRTILREADIPSSDVETVNVGFNLVPAMLSKKVDATLGAFWNVEGVELDRRKRDPQVIRLEEVGVPEYDELVIVASTTTVRDRGKLVRRMLQGLARGHERLQDDPAVGVDALVDAEPDLERDVVEEQVRRTVPLFFPEDDQRPWGWQDPVAWERYGRWMLDNDLLDRPAEPTALTNEFLPGGGI